MEPPLHEIIGTNIRNLARLRGWSLDAVADFAGVSRRQLYSLLAGEHDVTVGWLAKVAESLDVQTWELLRPTSAPESTLADFAVASTFTLRDPAGIRLDDVPAVADWIARMEARPSWSRAVAAMPAL